MSKLDLNTKEHIKKLREALNHAKYALGAARDGTECGALFSVDEFDVAIKLVEDSTPKKLED